MKHNYFDTFYLKICSQVEQSAPGFVPLLAPVLEVLAVPGFEAAVPGLAPLFCRLALAWCFVRIVKHARKRISKKQYS